MVGRGTIVSLAIALSGCLETGSVELHLCPPPELSPEERSDLQRASTWEVVVYLLRGDSAYARRSFAGDSEAASVLLSAGYAIPQEEPLRLVIVGHAAGGTGASDRVAIANSEELRFEGAAELCLCTAPPDRWGEVCLQRGCAFDPTAGCRF